MREELELKNIYDVFKKFNSFAIYGHMNTDFDCMASCLAVKEVLEKMGKTAHIFIDSLLPYNSFTLSGYEKINAEKLKSYDVAIVLDSAREDRLARNNYKFKRNIKTSVLIDHHQGTRRFCEHCYLVPGASSTCELLYNFFKATGIEITPEVAKLLISGIYTDTGSLQYSGAVSSTFMAVKNLLEIAKVSINEIVAPIFFGLSKKAFELKKFCYGKIELLDDYQIALLMLSADDFINLNVSFEETEGLTDVGMQLSSVKLMALMSESPDDRGAYRISLRSKGSYNVRLVAESFGGGGHNNAAGCKLKDSPKNVREKILNGLRGELNRK